MVTATGQSQATPQATPPVAGAISGSAASAIQRLEIAGPLGETARVMRSAGREIRLFFVCGHPKSGTNWVGAILNLHPQVACYGEFRFEALRRGFDTLERQWWHVASAEPVKQEAERCFRESVARIMLAALSSDPDGLRAAQEEKMLWVGDRTPRRLAEYIPGASSIYVMRDPRDVLVSWTHQELREWGVNVSAPALAASMQPLHKAFAADPQHFNKHPHDLLSCEAWVRFAARRYANHVRPDLELIEQSQSSANSMPIHVVRYEMLHQDLAGQTRAMFAFLGCDPGRANEPGRQTRTLAGFGREDPTSFFRKGAVGDWRIHFSDTARKWFDDETPGLLERMGYERKP